MDTIAERVAKGAAFLDEREPGWDQRIDLYNLDLAAECRCVLGQLSTDLTGNWERIVARYGLVNARDGKPGQRSDADYGFNISFSDALVEVSEYKALTAEWRRAIEARRAA